jgi:hypothetical protein
MNFKKTKIRLLVCMITFAVITSFVVYGFLKLEEMESSASLLEQEVIQEKESIQTFDSLVKNFSNIKEESQKANTFFIKKDEVVDFLNKIEGLASTTNTQISIQAVTDKNTGSSSSLLSVGVKAHGSYSNLYYLLRILEELPYQAEIQNVRLTNQRTTNDKGEVLGSWTADITIVGVMY